MEHAGFHRRFSWKNMKVSIIYTGKLRETVGPVKLRKCVFKYGAKNKFDE